jgi:aryl-alcohol dehydrogenase-like predicted oxidoreductase
MRYLSTENGKKISKIGLGTVQFGSPDWDYGRQYNEKEAHAIAKRAIDLGVNLFDTAEIYSSGRSEQILGQAIANWRDSVFLATKLWPVLPAARMVRKRAFASARRLGVTHLDLYQVHWPHPLFGDRAIMSGMRSLQVEGTVGEVGVSMYSLRRWRAADDALGGRVLSNQIAYSLLDRSPEQELLPFAEDNGRVIIAHSPLAQGVLSGRYHGTDRNLNRVRTINPAFRPESLERTRDLLDVVREVADAHKATPAQIALSWVIRPRVVVAIPGASSVRQLEENAEAAEIELADDEYLALSKASAQLCPAAPGEVSAPRKLRRQLSALRHTAWGTRQLAKTVRHDRSYARHPHRAPKDASRPPSASAEP